MHRYTVFALLVFIALGLPAIAADNELTDQEKRDGWMLLFDGKSLTGWTTNDGQPSARPVEQGSLNPHRCGGYMLIHERQWDNFILTLDFKISPGCNTGLFFRTAPLKPLPGKDVGYNGLEVAIDDTRGQGFTDTGAIYGLVAANSNVMRPAGEWNHLVLTCNKNIVEVRLNRRTVTMMDLDMWTDKGRRPNGTPHKFEFAYKDHPRRGYIGLQDHGGDCWYKNIKLQPLK
ncbi:hypothetical protein CA54_43300 [Symmachiella macrocystis]|uniref:3-keto-alpha-glucoside-1,2-lyase/3-keto-2-hydroxy-glucal hydratase domain-containing protein n=1 Tax=Symmachiella macrocystis TaxID=2527985 RepID=A0A5C6BAR3_9PLAN|nr:DUF1080 domain-containing protein [Symmachiella macrocystis]TWU09090.1 hypothetical protein CA54_43300 [Symmachiella macrocystis]